MAGDWIQLTHGLRDVPEVVAMSNTLNCDRDLVVGKLARIWGWFDANTRDGLARGVRADFVDQYVEMPGFAAAMHKANWLKANAQGIVMPGFAKRHSQSAKQRLSDAKRQRASRSCHNNVTHPRDKSVTREEKRTEEKSREEKKKNTPPPPPPPTSSSSPAAALAGDKGWVVVVEELVRLGMQDPKPAVAQARANGCSPDFVRSLIQVYRSRNGAWEPGALRRRLFNAFPGQDPASFWMPPRQKAIERESRDRSLAEDDKRRRESQERHARLRAAQEAAAQRLEGIDDAVLRQAIETAFARQPFALNAARKEWREKGRNGVIRGMFAESIAAAIRTPPIEEERHSGQGEN